VNESARESRRERKCMLEGGQGCTCVLECVVECECTYESVSVSVCKQVSVSLCKQVSNGGRDQERLPESEQKVRMYTCCTLHENMHTRTNTHALSLSFNLKSRIHIIYIQR